MEAPVIVAELRALLKGQPGENEVVLEGCDCYGACSGIGGFKETHMIQGDFYEDDGKTLRKDILVLKR